MEDADARFALRRMKAATALRILLGFWIAALTACGTDERVPSGAINRAPVALAGIAQIVQSGAAVTLDGRESTDPDNDVLTFAWSQDSGTAVTLLDSLQAQSRFTAPTVTEQQVLVFRLRVTDSAGVFSEATTAVTVRPPVPPPNQVPIAAAGVDQKRGGGETVNLDGRSSRDADGDALTFAWSQVSGPGVTLADADSSTPTFTAPDLAADTPLVFRLVARDARGAESADEVQINVDSVLVGISDFIDPRIGSYPPGFTNPGPVVPFGMVALGPDTEGPLNYGGYSVQNALITGFSHVHMSAGVFKAGQFPVLPITGEQPLPSAMFDPGSYGYPGTLPPYASPFDHATEVAEAGYYSALLSRYGVLAELTATERVGVHRYTYFNPLQAPRVLLDLSRSNGGYRPAAVTLDDDGTLTGRVRNNDAGGFDIYFAARLNRSFTAQTFAGAVLVPGVEQTGDALGLILDFETDDGTAMLKLALSYTDEAGARRNLDAEMPGWDFDATRAQAKLKWDRALSRIRIEGGLDTELTSFYTALYRLYHFPNLHSDVDGRYRGPDRAIHHDTRPHYSQFSSWDSYRGQNAMQAEIFPDVYRDMTRSLLDFHRQAGFLPRWQQGPNDASHMSGDPIMPFIGEGWCRGLYDSDLRAQLWPALETLVERRDPQLAALGYLAVPEPASPVEAVEGGPGRAGTTLEYGIADFSLALMAQDAAPADVDAITERSLNYRNLLDAETQWIRPRRDDGAFIETFAPELGYGFQEGTSWQYSWLAMHDYAGLIERMGGDAAVDRRLDLFFNFPSSQAPLVWPSLQNQITAFGVAYYGNQFAPGNEHDLETPYVYHYSGAPWKSQAVARAAASIYAPTPAGLPGNDDLGALSGWLLWTMAGLYPINPGTPLAVVGSPHFEKVTLRRPTGDLIIEAPGASPVSRFVNGLQLDGTSLQQSWLILPRGPATVRLSTSPIPDLAWGAAANARPPSLSTHPLSTFACTAQ